MTLLAASNIERTADLFTSRTGYDEGSTYFCFSCRHCQTVLGKYYVTTSEDLDELRDKFSFSVDEIKSYELGKSQHGKLPEPEVIIVPKYDENEEKQVEFDKGKDHDEVLKLQHVILNLSSRLEKVEEFSLLMAGQFPSLGNVPQMNHGFNSPHTLSPPLAHSHPHSRMSQRSLPSSITSTIHKDSLSKEVSQKRAITNESSSTPASVALSAAATSRMKRSKF